MTKKCFFLASVLFAAVPLGLAVQDMEAEQSGQEAAQAQATMASLFGRGVTMPSLPHMGGTIALPSFDSSEIEVSEESLAEAQQRELDAVSGTNGI